MRPIEKTIVDSGQFPSTDLERLVSHTLDAKIATEIRLGHVYMLDLYINIVDLAIRLLRADKLAS